MLKPYRCLGCMEINASGYEVCPRCGYVYNASAQTAEQLTPGSYLSQGSYLVGRLMSVSEASITYLGFDTRTQQPVSITEFMPRKLVSRDAYSQSVRPYSPAAAASFSSAKMRFSGDLQRISSIRPERGTINVTGFFQENGTVYAVSERFDGCSFEEHIRSRGGRLSLEETLSLLADVFQAVEKLNTANIFLCGISPYSIAITQTGKAKLALAEALALVACFCGADAELSNGYMAEECYRYDGDTGAFTDTFSLAAVVYRACCARTPENAWVRRAGAGLIHPSKCSTGMTKSRENALLNALNVDPDSRTAGAMQLYHQLRSRDAVARVDDSCVSSSDKSMQKKISTVAIIAVCAAIVLALSLFGVFGKAFGKNAEAEISTPDFVGLNLDEARKLAKDNGVLLQLSGKMYSSAVAEELIAYQEPAAGESMYSGGIVTFIISAGPEEQYADGSTMPDVTLLSVYEAKQRLDGLNIEYELEYIHCEEIAKDLIISSSIEEGAHIEPGMSVTLTVSLGSETPAPAAGSTETPDRLHTPKPGEAPMPTAEAVPVVTPAPTLNHSDGDDYGYTMNRPEPTPTPTPSATPEPTPTPDESSQPSSEPDTSETTQSTTSNEQNSDSESNSGPDSGNNTGGGGDHNVNP